MQKGYKFDKKYFKFSKITNKNCLSVPNKIKARKKKI